MGAGKTEFIRHLRRILRENENMRPRVCVVEEPVEEWMRMSFGADMGPLQAQYRYPTMYGAPFQAYAYTTHLQCVCDALRTHVDDHDRLPELLFVERFPGYSNYHVFLRALHDAGFIDEVTLTMTRRMFDAAENAELFRTMVGGEEPLSLEFIYVDAPLPEMVARVNERARERAAEDRLRRIYQRYETWLGRGANLWLDDRTLVPHDIRTVRNEEGIFELGEEAERIVNAELARARLDRDMFRLQPDDDIRLMH